MNKNTTDRLKRYVLDDLSNHQVFTTKDRLIFTTGSQQAIDILINMPFPNKKTKILVEQPSYYGALCSAKLSNSDVIGISVKNYNIDLDELEDIFKNNDIKLFYIMSRFHNPLGHSYSNKTKQKIAELSDKYDVYILEDDFLGDLDLNSKSDPIFTFNPNGKIIYVKSFSKILFPGLRVATVILPKDLIKDFRYYKFCRDFSTPSLSLEIIANQFENGILVQHLTKMKKLYYLKMKEVKRCCYKYLPPSMYPYIPDTGFYFSLKLPDNISSRELADVLKQKKILVNSLDNCFIPKFQEINLIRLSISKVTFSDIDYGIKKLGKTVLELQKNKDSIFKY